jgi:hypothetical protein
VSTPSELSSRERAAADLSRVFGWPLTVLGSLAVLLWWTGQSGEDPHGGMFAAVLAVWIAPVGFLFLLAGYALRHRWRFRWLLFPIPVLYLAGATLFLFAASQ